MSEQEQQEKVNPIQVQKFLGGIDYPTDKQTIIDTAKREGADERVLSTLSRIPDKQYNGPNEVSRQIGNLD